MGTPVSMPQEDGCVLISDPRFIFRAAMMVVLAACFFALPVRQSRAADPLPGDAASAAGCVEKQPRESANIFRFREWMARAEAGTAALARSRNLVVATWRREIEALRSAPARQQMARVNRLVNNLVSYRLDADGETWGEPLESLTKGGDCEDYALLKAYSLVRLGWPLQALYLVAGRVADGRSHAMLLVELNGEAYLLDNMARTPFEAEKYPWLTLYRLGLTGPGS